MSDYRKDAKEVVKETHWTFWKFLPVFLIIVVVLSIIGFGMNSMGLLGKTIVERKVFENSFQRSESLKSEIAMNEAVINEIGNKLLNPNLDANTRFNLKAQLSAATIRVATAKGKK